MFIVDKPSAIEYGQITQMPKLNEYICRQCATRFEYIHENTTDIQKCPQCESTDSELQLGSYTLTTIIPTYRGCKRQKAGYVHSHGDRPAEKGSVSVPRTMPSNTGGKYDT